MAHITNRIERLMTIRQAVIEGLAKQPDASVRWMDQKGYYGQPVPRSRLTPEEEQVVATYLLALMVDDVADSIIARNNI